MNKDIVFFNEFDYKEFNLGITQICKKSNELSASIEKQSGVVIDKALLEQIYLDGEEPLKAKIISVLDTKLKNIDKSLRANIYNPAIPNLNAEVLKFKEAVANLIYRYKIYSEIFTSFLSYDNKTFIVNEEKVRDLFNTYKTEEITKHEELVNEFLNAWSKLKDQLKPNFDDKIMGYDGVLFYDDELEEYVINKRNYKYIKPQ